MSELPNEELRDKKADRPIIVKTPVTKVPSTNMKGELRGDFTRDTFDPTKNYTRVLMQQGRVQLDADWNEQADILLHYMRALAADLIGPFGGPCSDAGFKIEFDVELKDLKISRGHYYVDGILCENNETVTYFKNFESQNPKKQPNYPLPDKYVMPEPPFLVYLDVWERTITCSEDNNIREIALGLNGPDTAIRSQLVWQVKVFSSNDFQKDGRITPEEQRELKREFLRVNECKTGWNYAKTFLRRISTGQLKAKAKQPSDITEPCNIKPEFLYRGKENQLYRIEIHDSGVDDKSISKHYRHNATFKWSRENSSVTFPIIALQMNESILTGATLAHLGRDDRTTLSPDDWVEIIDDDHVLMGEPGDLLKIISVDRSNMIVTFSNGRKTSFSNKNLHLRRWDHKLTETGTLKVQSGETEWLDLEDGIQVQFKQGYYNTGDYWLIPARTSIGDVLWPYVDEEKIERQYLPPHGIEHHYAPLAFVTAGEGEIENRVIDCRCTFNSLCGIGKEKYIKIIDVRHKEKGENIYISTLCITNLPKIERILCTVIDNSATYTTLAQIKKEFDNFNYFEATVLIPKPKEEVLSLSLIITAIDLNCQDIKDIYLTNIPLEVGK